LRTIGFALVLVLLATSCSGQSGAKHFRLVGYETTERYTGLRFEAGDEWRTIVFMDGSDGGLAIRGPKVEGVLEWNDLVAIRITPFQTGSASSFAVVEYFDGYDHSRKTFEMGMIDSSRLKELKHRYGKYVSFVTK